MTVLEAIVLGIVQGLTEFLPISSTAHLTLAGKLMVNDLIISNPKAWTAFMAVIQLGTMAAVIVYFWSDLWKIVPTFLKENVVERKRFSEQSLDSRMGWYIIVGTLPVAVIGLVFKDTIEGAFTKNLTVISLSLLVLGILLAVAEKTGSFTRDEKGITWMDSLVVGCAQALALIPGSSRSGTTLTAGLFLGLKRETAARFSFLLSIPAVLASGLFELKETLPDIHLSGSVNLVVATVAAALSGYLAIDFLLRFLRRNSTFLFVYYRVLLGSLILVLIGLKVIVP